MEQALDGNLGAIRLYVDVMHGKQVQPIELSGPDGESIRAEQTNVVAVILGALAAFPEAKLAVAAELRGLSSANHGTGEENPGGPDDGNDASA